MCLSVFIKVLTWKHINKFPKMFNSFMTHHITFIKSVWAVPTTVVLSVLLTCTIFTIHILIHPAGAVVCLCSLGFVFFDLHPCKHTGPLLSWVKSHLLPLSCTTEPTLQALSLSLLVPKQQPLLVYRCVFALWFSSEQHNSQPLRGLIIWPLYSKW